MEALCFMPLFAIFLIGSMLRNHQNDSVPPTWNDDNNFVEDMIMLDILSDDDNW